MAQETLEITGAPHLQTSVQALSSAVNAVAKAAAHTAPPRMNDLHPDRSNLTAILIEATSDKAPRLLATDGSTAIMASLPGEVLEPGRILVHASSLARVAKALPPDTTVSLTAGERIQVEWDHGMLSLESHSAHDFPNMKVAGKKTLTVSGKALQQLVRRVAHASATRDDGRIFTTSIHLSASQGRLTAMATDNHRLAIGNVPCIVARSGEALVSMKGLRVVTQVFSSQEKVAVSFNDKHVLFRGETYTARIEVVRAQFPDPRGLLERAMTARAVCDGAALASALRRAKTVVNPNNDGMDFDFAMNEVVLSRKTWQAEIRETLAAQVSGAPIHVRLNRRMVDEALHALGTAGPVTIELTGEESPMRISRTDDDDFVVVIMPLRMG